MLYGMPGPDEAVLGLIYDDITFTVLTIYLMLHFAGTVFIFMWLRMIH